jgi:acetyl esterase/lipase
LFLDESKRYEAKLREHNVEVQMNLYPGVPHGFDGIASLTLREKLWEDEAQFIKRF